MSNHRIYSVFCDCTMAATYLKLDVAVSSASTGCVGFGPATWRESGGSHSTADSARRTAQKEGWKRVKVETGHGPEFFDICPKCYVVLEPAVKVAGA